MVPDSPHKIFIGGLPNYLNDEQVSEESLKADYKEIGARNIRELNEVSMTFINAFEYMYIDLYDVIHKWKYLKCKTNLICI